MQALNTGTEIMYSLKRTWIVTTLEVITQPSLSEMFLELQYPDLGHEEVALVVRVDPKKPSPNHQETNFASLASHTLSAEQLGLTSSQSNGKHN